MPVPSLKSELSYICVKDFETTVYFYIVAFWGLCYGVRYDFRINTMLVSSFAPVVCYVIYACFLKVVSNTYCVVFYLSSSMLPISLDCPILIAPTVFSNVYLNQYSLIFELITICFFFQNRKIKKYDSENILT